MLAIVVGVLGLLSTVVVGILVKVLSDDARTGIPKISASIVLRAARRLPAEARDRYREEWLAALGEMDERSVMLAHAIGCLLFAAPRIGTELGDTRSLDTRTLLIKAFPDVGSAERKWYACKVLDVDEATVDGWIAGTARPNWQHRCTLRLLVSFEAILALVFRVPTT